VKENGVPSETKEPDLENVHVPALASEDTTETEADALYAQGMAHYRRREWKEARERFARLKAIAPDRRGVDTLLNEVDIFIQLQAMQPDQRAAVPATESRRLPRTEIGVPRQAVAARPARGHLSRPAIALALTAVIVIALALYASGTIGKLIGSQRQARVQSLINQGRAALNVGEYDRAVKAFGDALALSPGNEEIKTWYKKAERFQQLTSLCTQAQADIAAAHWASALDKLQQIIEWDPTFCNAVERTTLVKSQQALEARYAEGQDFFKQANWAETIRVLERLRDEAATFRSSEVQQTLFLAYFRQGVDWMARAGDSLNLVNQAIQSFDSALALYPSDSTALEEKRLASLYRQAYLFVGQKDWPQAVVVLQQIHDGRPDYMEGRAISMLCASFLQLGDVYHASGNLEQALQQYKNVLAIKDCDHVQAAIKEREVYLILNPPTPTPTRTPPPTRTPRPTPTATATPSPTPRPPPPVEPTQPPR
jgi:tetratricopeptide (TPR) repeat protein